MSIKHQLDKLGPTYPMAQDKFFIHVRFWIFIMLTAKLQNITTFCEKNEMCKHTFNCFKQFRNSLNNISMTSTRHLYLHTCCFCFQQLLHCLVKLPLLVITFLLFFHPLRFSTGHIHQVTIAVRCTVTPPHVTATYLHGSQWFTAITPCCSMLPIRLALRCPTSKGIWITPLVRIIETVIMLDLPSLVTHVTANGAASGDKVSCMAAHSEIGHEHSRHVTVTQQYVYVCSCSRYSSNGVRWCVCVCSRGTHITYKLCGVVVNVVVAVMIVIYMYGAHKGIFANDRLVLSYKSIIQHQRKEITLIFYISVLPRWWLDAHLDRQLLVQFYPSYFSTQWPGVRFNNSVFSTIHLSDLDKTWRLILYFCSGQRTLLYCHVSRQKGPSSGKAWRISPRE